MPRRDPEGTTRTQLHPAHLPFGRAEELIIHFSEVREKAYFSEILEEASLWAERKILEPSWGEI